MMKTNGDSNRLTIIFTTCIIVLLIAIATILLFDNFPSGRKKTSPDTPLTTTVDSEQSDQEEAEESEQKADDVYRDYVASKRGESVLSDEAEDFSDYSDEAEPIEDPSSLAPSTYIRKISPDVQRKAKEKVASMTLSEKVCQLFFITPEQLTGIGCVVQAGDPTKLALEDYPIGGLIYFTSNLKTREQVKGMLANIRAFSDIPPFAGIDEEGGRVARVPESGIDVPRFDNMNVIGQSGDPAKAFEVGNTIGGYLSELGFDVDFAPDSDIVSDVNQSAIGARSFGGDPELVSTMVSNVVKGLQQNNIEPCIKHFPGLGASNSDTHNGFTVFDKTLDDLKQNDLIPFEKTIAQGINFVMVGHGSYPNVTGDNTPASMSYSIITGLLREELQYDGIIITDALNMGAITDSYSSGEVAVNVIKAGADMLLMPSDFQNAYHSLLSAVQSGELTEARIDESVTRILEVKYSKAN
ncbi:MAG: glycoside hydrolase family 3 protein [Lachnospiraceae bacterium]